MKQRVAILQRDIVWRDIKANQQAIERMLDGVAADVVVLSEMFQTGFVVDPEGVADRGDTLEWMQRLSRRLGAAVVGSVAVSVDGENVTVKKTSGSYTKTTAEGWTLVGVMEQMVLNVTDEAFAGKDIYYIEKYGHTNGYGMELYTAMHGRRQQKRT